MHQAQVPYILLVEDNPSDAILTQRTFKKQGIRNEVRHAKDGAEALEILHGDPDAPLPFLVLLDLKLPRVDGLEVLQRIRAHPRTEYLPVVVLTSSREQRDVISSYAHRANSYIRKPVNHKEFSEAVRQLGFYWLLLNEPPPGIQKGP